MTPDIEKLIVRLRERATESDKLVAHVAGGNAELCTAAADALASLVRERDAARELLRDLLRCEYESAGFGLADCIDNTGKPYQSAHLDSCLKRAERSLSSEAP